MPREQKEVLRDLKKVGRAITRHSAALEELYETRIQLWREGRDLDPPAKVGDLGAAAGVGEAAVINTLKKRREAEAAAG